VKKVINSAFTGKLTEHKSQVEIIQVIS